MQGSLFFTIFHDWPILVVLILVPALLAVRVYERRTTGTGWRNSSLVGLDGVILGIAVPVAWFLLWFCLPESTALCRCAVLPVPAGPTPG